VPPGTYTLRLTVNGRAYTQPVAVHADPRSVVTPAGLQAQHALQMKLVAGMRASWDGYQQATALRDAAHRAVSPNASAEVTAALGALDAAIDSVRGDTATARAFNLAGGPAPDPRFVDVNAALVARLLAQDYADQAPTPAMLAGWTKICKQLATAATNWERVRDRSLATFNGLLERHQIPRVPAPSTRIAAPACVSGSVESSNARR
jgi:hypothetical protein